MRKYSTTKKEEILRSASRLFLSKGYHATSLADIAAAVGVLKGSLYHHIESKDELLFEIVVRHLASARADLMGAGPQEAARPDVKLLLPRHILYLCRHYASLVFLLRESEHLPRFRRELIAKSVDQHEEAIAEMIRAGQRAALIPAGDCRVYARMLLAACAWNGWKECDIPARTRIGEQIVRLLLVAPEFRVAMGSASENAGNSTPRGEAIIARQA